MKDVLKAINELTNELFNNYGIKILIGLFIIAVILIIANIIVRKK